MAHSRRGPVPPGRYAFSSISAVKPMPRRLGVDPRQVAIENDAVAAQDEDGARDVVNRLESQSLRLSHGQFARSAGRGRVEYLLRECIQDAPWRIMVVDGPRHVETQ